MSAEREPDTDLWVSRVAAAAEGYEFRTFLLGTSPPKDMPPDEVDRFKRIYKDAVGRALEIAWPERVVDFVHPDIRFILVPRTGDVRITSMPLFVYGRYVKDCRDIPQARWHCQRCHGKGCRHCEGTGHRFTMTVEEAVTRPLRERSGAIESRLHGAGREDIDARMLGRGRPFVVTLREPRIRTIDLEAAAAEAPDVSGGRVSVRELRFVPREYVKRVTQARSEKVYRASVVCEGDLPPDAADRVRDLAPVTLRQQTPQRVLKRRSDLVRYRRVLAVELASTGPRTLDLTLRTEAGTYVKEFVSGDEDRTRPSLSSLLGVPCRVEMLDVLEVDLDPFA